MHVMNFVSITKNTFSCQYRDISNKMDGVDENVQVKIKREHKFTSIFTIFNNLYKRKNESKRFFIQLVNIFKNAENDSSPSKEVEYIVNRLVRGLGSARVDTQNTNFAILTCLLAKSLITFDDVIKAAEKELSKSNQLSSGEEALVNLGNILVYQAVIRSGCILREKKKISEIVDKVLVLGKSKTYLSSLSYSVLVDLLSLANESLFLKKIWPSVSTHVELSYDSQTVDSLYFLLTAVNSYPKFASIFADQMGSTASSLNSLARILLTEPMISSGDHPVFEAFSRFLCNSEGSPQTFWVVEVDPLLKKLTPNKAYRALILLSYTVKYLTDKSLLPKLLTPSVIDLIVHELSFIDKKIFNLQPNIKRGKSLLDDIVQALSGPEVSDETRVQTVRTILLHPRNLYFEQKTGTRCVQLITQQCGKVGIDKLLDLYHQIITCQIGKAKNLEGDTESWFSKERVYVLRLYVKLLNHSAVKDDLDWKLEKLQFVFEIGFLPDNPTTQDVRKSAKESLYYALNLQCSKLEQLISVLDKFVDYVDEMLLQQQNLLDESSKTAWLLMMKTVKKIRKKTSTGGCESFLHVLFIHMGLQLFNDNALAKENLEELHSCYKRIKTSRKSQTPDNEPQWIEVAVDMILSLLSRENKLWRHVIGCTFPHLVQHLTVTTLQQIVDALDPNSVNNPLNKINEDSDESEAEKNEESNDEDEDEIQNGVEESEESNIESDMEEQGTVNDQLRTAVRDALGYSAGLTDNESEDMDNMGEEEEKRLNERLGQAFKLLKQSKKRNKKKQSKEDAALTHFRTRVLDLIDIYVTHQPAMSGCLDLILPLFVLLENAIKDYHQKPLQNRVESILKKLANTKKFSDVDNVDPVILVTVFQALIKREDVSAVVYSELGPRVSECCTFLIRCSQQLNSRDNEGETNCKKNKKDKTFVKEYVSLLSCFKARNFKLPISIFQSALRLVWSGNWKLVSALYELVFDDDIRLFKRNKVLELLHVFYMNHRLLSEGTDKQKKVLSTIEETFINNLIQYLDSHSGELNQSKAVFQNFLSNIMGVIKVAHKSWMIHRHHMENPPQWVLIFNKIKELEISSTNQTNAKITKLASVFQVKLPHLSSKKRKREELSVNEGSDKDAESGDEISFGKSNAKNGKAKKKKKMNVETMKLKKQSRHLREGFSSQGLQLVNFSEIKAYTLKGADESVTAEDGKSKKRKNKQSDIQESKPSTSETKKLRLENNSNSSESE